MISGYVLVALAAFAVGVLAGNVFRVRMRVWREVPPSVVETRFRVSSKKGTLLTNNIVEVAQEIEKLRALKQPYTYRMDGRIVKQEGDRG